MCELPRESYGAVVGGRRRTVKSCPENEYFFLLGDKCYFYKKGDTKSSYWANDMCTNTLSGRLWEPRSLTEYSEFIRRFQNHDGAQVRIGIKYVTQWAYLSDSSEALTFAPWADGFPLPQTGNREFASLTGDYPYFQWVNDQHRSVAQEYVCEVEPILSILPECPDGWEYLNGPENMYCYKYFGIKVTQAAARDFCATAYPSAKLWEPEFYSTTQNVGYSISKAYRNMDIWIGLHDRDTEGSYV